MNDITIQMLVFNPMILQIIWTNIRNVAEKIRRSENEVDIDVK